jgi:hypothetical protein
VSAWVIRTDEASVVARAAMRLCVSRGRP